MDALIRLIVVSASLACAIGGNPGYFGYQQTLPTSYIPTFYQPLPPPQPIIRYHAPPQPIIRYNAPPQPIIRYNAPLPVAATLPQHYYSAPPQNAYRGFAYQTEYQHGGRSRVVFVTGPESQQLMEQSLAAFRQIITSTPFAAPASLITAPSSVPLITKTAPTIISQPINTQRIINPIFNPQTIVQAKEINSQPIYNSQPIINSAPAISPVASVYSIQVFPTPGNASPFVRVPFPHHPFISSFYSQQSQTNATNVETESEIEGKGSASEASTEETITETAENIGEAEENIFGAEENVGEEKENVDQAAAENQSEAEETGGDPQESKVNIVDTAVPSLFLRLRAAEDESPSTASAPTTFEPETSRTSIVSAIETSATEASSQVTEAMEITTAITSKSDQSDVSEGTSKADDENTTSASVTDDVENQTTVANN